MLRGGKFGRDVGNFDCYSSYNALGHGERGLRVMLLGRRKERPYKLPLRCDSGGEEGVGGGGDDLPAVTVYVHVYA